MKKAYRIILESVLQYEQNQNDIISILFAITVVLVSVLLIKQYKKIKVSDQIAIFATLLSLCTIFSLYTIHKKEYYNNITSDISSDAFISYEGKFIHDDYQKDSFYHNLYITDESSEQILLRFPDYSNQYNLWEDRDILPVGEYTGTIVYSKDSKIVVYWIVDT